MVYVLFIVIALVSFAVQRTLQSKFERYSKIPIPYGLKIGRASCRERV